MDIFRDVSAASPGPAVSAEQKWFVLEILGVLRWNKSSSLLQASVGVSEPDFETGKVQVTFLGWVFLPPPPPFASQLPLLCSGKFFLLLISLPNCWAPQRCFREFQPSFPRGNVRVPVWEGTFCVNPSSGGAPQGLWLPAGALKFMALKFCLPFTPFLQN